MPKDLFQVPIVGEQREPPKKRFSPTGTFVVFHEYKADTSHGGVALPQTRREVVDLPTCLVIAAGPDCKWIKEGDTIVIGNVIVSDFRFGGETYSLLKEEHILGVVGRELKEKSSDVK